MFWILVSLRTASGQECAAGTIEGGIWSGEACHYERVSDSPLAPCDGGGFETLSCGIGSTVEARGRTIQSDVGQYYCDFSPNGQAIGGVVDAGPFCCEGIVSDFATAGIIDGTCFAASAIRPEELTAGCQHSPQGTWFALLAALCSRFARRKL